MTPRLPRRRFLQVAGAVVVLSACGDDRSATDAATTNAGGSPDPGTSSSVLVALFSTDRVIAAGSEQRIPFAAFNDDRTPRRDDALPASTTVRISRDGAEVAAVQVERHGEGLPFPYYPLRATLPEPGIYHLTAELDDGPATLAVQAFDPAEVSVPQPGEAMPALPTPTTADPGGVDPLCTRFEPCPLHGTSLHEALGTTPVALLVGTPAFCQTGVCGPALEQLLAVADAYPGVTLIHAEVYANPAEVGGNLADPALRPAPVTQSLGLNFEPLVFVVRADGTIAERLDNVFDRAELERALSQVA